MEGRKEIQTIEKYGHLKFPEGLSKSDKDLIIKQCEHQQATGDQEILGFAVSYLEAKQIGLDSELIQNLNSNKIELLILKWASQMEKRNEKGKENQTRKTKHRSRKQNENRKGNEKKEQNHRQKK